MHKAGSAAGAGPAASRRDPFRFGRGEKPVLPRRLLREDRAMTYRIRTVRGEEWQRLRELWLTALADPAASVAFNETYENAAQQGEGFWRRRAAQGAEGHSAETFIAEEEGRGGGWVGMATVLDEGESAHVVGVYVRPEHRGTGLAERLLRTVAGWAWERPHVKRMLLHVHEHNSRAEAFYQRIGYARTGGFVSDPKAPVLKEYEMVWSFRSGQSCLVRSTGDGSSGRCGDGMGRGEPGRGDGEFECGPGMRERR